MWKKMSEEAPRTEKSDFLIVLHNEEDDIYRARYNEEGCVFFLVSHNKEMNNCVIVGDEVLFWMEIPPIPE